MVRSSGTRRTPVVAVDTPTPRTRTAPTRSGGTLLDRTGDRLRKRDARPTTGTTAPRSNGSTVTRRSRDGLLGRVDDHLKGRDTRTPRPVDRSDYRGAWRGGYRVACGPTYRSPYHGWYDDHHWYLSFSFGVNCGPYFGVSYYRPYHSFVYGCDYAFFYPAPVTYCYVPFGFYTTTTPVYVTRYAVVRETVPVTVYEERVTVTEEEAASGDGPAAPPAEDADVKVAEPIPAAGSPATEKFLREASDLFRKKEYYEAAVKFRLAALSSPDLPGPLFALGQSLVAMEQDAYAAKVLRRAVEMSPKMLEETGDISGVWESSEEFDRVMKSLEVRAAASPVDGDARFLLAAERYFAGDVRSREGFDLLHEARPQDAAVEHFRVAAANRFKGGEELPAIEKR